MGMDNKGSQKAVESLVSTLERIRTKVERSRMTPEERAAYIPATASYEDSPLHDVWDKFPLGIHANNEEAVWDSSASNNVLLVGDTFSEELIQRNIIFHCIRNSDHWDFVGIDLSRVELAPYTRHSSTSKVITSVEDGVAALRDVCEEMMERFELLDRSNVAHVRDLPQSPKSLMVMVPRAYWFLALTGNKSDEGRESDMLRGEARYLLNHLAVLGRPVGIHLVLITERLSLDFMNHELIENCTTRIATHRMNAAISERLFGDEHATLFDPSIKGRGFVQHHGKGAEFQAYWSDRDFLPVIRD